jgi:N-formylglutamate amidohydrolase
MAKSRFYPERDPFTFMFETVDSDGKMIEQLGGSDNIRAAHAAFEAIVQTYRPTIRLQLRHGGRIMIDCHWSAP